LLSQSQSQSQTAEINHHLSLLISIFFSAHVHGILLAIFATVFFVFHFSFPFSFISLIVSPLCTLYTQRRVKFLWSTTYGRSLLYHHCQYHLPPLHHRSHIISYPIISYPISVCLVPGVLHLIEIILFFFFSFLHSLRFVVAAGNMPCHVTLFNCKAESIYEFGAAHRNTISWSPHGRFLLLAGFGNLAGEMDFFDTLRLRKIGSNTAHCSVSHGWSPCSRYSTVQFGVV
jgi:Eukaryotic translation initiation factor eIF2A